MKKIIISILLLGSIQAQALTLSARVVDAGVGLMFPKVIKKVEISEPKVDIKDNKAIFCAFLNNTLIQTVFQQKVYMCSKFIPAWNTQTKEIMITKMSEIRLTVKKDGHVQDKWNTFFKLLETDVLPQLEPIPIYKMDNMIGNQVKSIKIIENQFDIMM